MDESQIIADGIKLGYGGKELNQYVEARVKRETKKLKEDAEREDRYRQREEDRAKRELELKIKELDFKQREAEAEAERRAAGNTMEDVRHVEHTRAQIKLSTFRDGEDVEVYLKTFEKVKAANRWTDEVAITALANGFVNSKIGAFLDSLPDNLPYTEIKNEVVKSFGIHIYDLFCKFNYLKQGDENFGQFILKLKEHLNKICMLAKVDNDFDKLLDVIIKDRVINSVDKNLARYLKENNIFQLDSDTLILMAENFQATYGKFYKRDNQTVNYNRNSIQNYSKPDVDRENNHFTSRACFKCNETGHISKYCTKKFSSKNVAHSNYIKDSNNFADANNKMKCYNCDESGHISKFCPKRKLLNNSDRESSVKVNFAYNSCSNVDKRLPVVSGKCNGKNVQILRDTGSTAILVHEKLIKTDYLYPNKVKVHFADGNSFIANKGKIYLKCIYFTGYVDAICLPRLPFDVIVGNVDGASCACVNEGNQLINNSKEHMDSMCYSVLTRAQIIKDNLPDDSTRINNLPITLDMTNISTPEFVALQLSDISLASCYEKAGSISDTFPKFVKINDVLVRQWNKSKNSKNIVNQIIVPKVLRNKIISLAHDTIMSGHLGVRKTQCRILSHFFWPGIYSDISRYCRSCEVCQKNSCGKPAKVPLINLPVISTPFYRVAVDLIGPLPRSSKGNRFALVFIDMATKYPDAVPLKRIDSESVAEALMDIFSRVGLPSEILHDKGTQFMSAVMKKFNQLLQIKSINTTAYNPKCNGTCENFNKTLKQMLKKITEDHPEIWDRYLQPLLFAYREVPQLSTGFSPFELLFGHEVRGPLFLIKDRILQDNTRHDEIPITEYVIQMREKIKQMLKMSNENEQKSKLKEKYYYDRNCRKRSFKLGDKVLLLLPTSNNKMLAEWKGPYEVVRRINKVDYVVRIEDTERMFHINMLKPFNERTCINESTVTCNAVIEEEQDCSSNIKVNPELSVNERDTIEVAVGECGVFSSAPGKINCLNYHIEVDPKVKPVASLPYKIPFHLKNRVKEELDKWLELGIIKKSDSPWASPVVTVINSDKSLRLTIDYRKLNPHINVDNFPMPDRDVVMHKLAEAKYMSKLDLTKAYFQFPLDEESTKYTSFVLEFGQFEFNVVPFGIRFASGLCNRIIKEILSSCSNYVTSFVDDLIIYSDSLDSHVKHIRHVLSELANAGITLNPKKCSFAQTSVKFLGFIVENGTVKPNPEKVSSIRNFPKPETKKQLRSFLGLINFYNVFVPHLATHVSKLTGLLCNDKSDKIVWDKDLSNCFHNAVKLVSDDALLFIPKKDCEFVLQTDASLLGIAAVLGQYINDKFRPIYFISRKLNKAEKNYAVIELECLAIKWAVDYFYSYLYGSKFKIMTDHAPLTWLKQNHGKNSRLTRWALSLQTFDFHIEYIKGSENLLADALSRAFY